MDVSLSIFKKRFLTLLNGQYNSEKAEVDKQKNWSPSWMLLDGVKAMDYLRQIQ